KVSISVRTIRILLPKIEYKNHPDTQRRRTDSECDAVENKASVRRGQVPEAVMRPEIYGIDILKIRNDWPFEGYWNKRGRHRSPCPPSKLSAIKQIDRFGQCKRYYREERIVMERLRQSEYAGHRNRVESIRDSLIAEQGNRDASDEQTIRP